MSQTQEVTKQNLTSEELLFKGKSFIKENNYDEAVDVLSQALHIIVEKYVNDQKSIDLIEYYLNYGKALLRLSQSVNDVFGDSIRNKQQEYDDEIKENGEEKEDEEDEKDENKNLMKNTNNDNNQTLLNSINESNKENESEENNDDVDENNMEENENNDYDASEDRELAWETLENARIIIEEFLQKKNLTHFEKDLNEESKKYMSMLAEIYCLLAESQMEEENFQGSLNDYQKALELRQICNDSWRELAYIHFMSSLCATYCRKNDISRQHLKDSAQLLHNRSIELLKSLNIINNDNDIIKQKTENENDFNIMSENEQLLSYLETTLKMENISNEKREELEDLKQNLTDLLNKLNEKNEEQETMNDNEKGLLSEMIQSILSKNNNLSNETIEEGDYEDDEDLEEMEVDQEFNYEADNTNNNVGKSNVFNGFTTIGFNSSTTENEEQQSIHNLGSFGKGNLKKRNIEQAEMDDNNSQTKKTRLSNAQDQTN